MSGTKIELADHPIADIFPLLDGPELKELAADIKANGLRVPIVLYEGKILDGRNRYRACLMVGVPFTTTEYTGDAPAAYVVSMNEKRRHLTPSQRAAAAVEALPWFEKEAKARQKGGQGGVLLPPNVEEAKGEATTQAGKALRVGRSSVADAKAIKKAAPKLFEAVRAGKKTIHKAKKELKAQTERRAMEKAAAELKPERERDIKNVCDIRHCSCAELFASGIKPDVVITDPPYPEKFLPVYTELALACKNVPLVAVMVGQSYLPEVLGRLCEHLDYRWTMAYLTPGGQAVQIWDRKVNTFWKPVLLFGAKPENWAGDVVSSDVNDNDKAHHHWGQSESGMALLVERLSKAGDLICDPFAGGGTTAVVAVSLNRRFVGCDIDAKSVAETLLRVRAVCK